MASQEDTHGRVFALSLPSLALLTHTLFAILALNHPGAIPRTDSFSSSYATWFALYNAVAAGASFAGLNGAIRHSPRPLKLFLRVHFITLTLCTLTIVNFLLPISVSLTSLLPFLPDLRFDAEATCDDTNGFGWSDDAAWAEQCRYSLFVVRMVLGGVAAVLLAAQWWAFYSAGRWARGLKAATGAENRGIIVTGGDMEKGLLLGEGQMVGEKRDYGRGEAGG